jgi:hypothetical protein
MNMLNLAKQAWRGECTVGLIRVAYYSFILG